MSAAPQQTDVTTTTTTTEEVPEGIVLDGSTYTAPADTRRSAFLGGKLTRFLQLPTLRQLLARWQEQIDREYLPDFTCPLSRLRLTGRGALTAKVEDKGGRRMTYRTFATLLRTRGRRGAQGSFKLARNVAENVHSLSTLDLGDSPQSIAYNDFLQRGNAIVKETGKGARDEAVVIRSRQYDAPVIVAAVTQTHSTGEGDDRVFVSALETALAGWLDTARGHVYRGLDVSELRLVLPSTVMLDGSVWRGYVGVLNSETGAKAWSVSAGLYREQDGVSLSVAVEAAGGRHVGHVLPRIVSALEAAQALVADLEQRAAGMVEEYATAHQLRVLRAACLEAGASEATWETESKGVRTKAEALSCLARLARGATTRTQGQTWERLAGNLLLHSWAGLSLNLPKGLDVE